MRLTVAIEFRKSRTDIPGLPRAASFLAGCEAQQLHNRIPPVGTGTCEFSVVSAGLGGLQELLVRCLILVQAMLTKRVTENGAFSLLFEVRWARVLD